MRVDKIRRDLAALRDRFALHAETSESVAAGASR